MAKLFMFAAALVALLAVAQVAYSSFIVTTTEVDGEEINQRGRPMQRCQQQIMQQSRNLRHCQMMMRRMPFEMDMEDTVSQGYGQQGQQMHRMRCCQALENMEDERCRCEAVRMMMRQMEGQGMMGEQEMEQMRERARYLPQMCNLEPQQCRV